MLPRASGGNYQRSEHTAVSEARVLFLQAVQRRAVGALEALRESVLPLISIPSAPFPLARVEWINRPDGTWTLIFLSAQNEQVVIEDSRRWVPFDVSRTDDPPGVARVRKGLTSWADQFHLRHTWVLNAALGTLRLWQIAPQSLKRTDWDLSFSWGISKRALEIDPPGSEWHWDPIAVWSGLPVEPYIFQDAWLIDRETRPEATRRIMESCATNLKVYLNRVESLARERGLKRAKQKRNPEHFEWLVDYQTNEWNHRKIADHYSKNGKILTEDAVGKALRGTAALIGLILRPPGRGGKPTSKPPT